MAEVTLTTNNFATEVEQFQGVTLVDFWATWCGPCTVMAPVIERIAEKYTENPKVKIGKLDVDTQPETSEKYGIRSIPAFVIFQNGTKIGSIVGIQPQPKLEEAIEKLLQTAPTAPVAA
jgi:thioredoxin 1